MPMYDYRCDRVRALRCTCTTTCPAASHPDPEGRPADADCICPSNPCTCGAVDCTGWQEAIVRYNEREETTFPCPEEGCPGTLRYAFISGGGPVYHMSIERTLEVERGHLPGYQPAPTVDTKTGRREYAGKVKGTE